MEDNPILVVDNDLDDLEMIEEAAIKFGLTRPIHFFKTGNELIRFLMDAANPPFLILCDLHLPGETGFDIRQRLAKSKELKYKSVPFIFWSNAASDAQIQFAYDLPAQGFFIKPNNFPELCETFKTILEYWQKSQHPKRLH